MQANPIILIGGLGTNTYYMKHFCDFILQYKKEIPEIHSFPLLHGKTIDEEVAEILSNLGDNDGYKYNVIGFSAGCSVALALAKKIQVDKIILCNPADIRHRFYPGAVDAIYDYSESFKDEYSSSSIFPSFWFVFFCLLGIIWNLLIQFNMTGTTMWLYYQVFGKRNYESIYTELEKNTKLFDELTHQSVALPPITIALA